MSQRYEFSIQTYGCKVNTYDTGLLQKRLSGLGHSVVSASSDKVSSGYAGKLGDIGLGARVPRVHILNTCAVTGEATREAAKAARRLKAQDPFATIVVTGCGAQVDGAIFDSLTAADLVVANSHKGQLEAILDSYFQNIHSPDRQRVYRSNIFRKDDLEAGGGLEQDHTRSFLKIQDGCNSFCTYCVIPFARGKSRSVSVADLVHRVRELEAGGVREVVLTGVHIGDYEDLVNGAILNLSDLVGAILRETKVARIRLSSLEPVELTDSLLDLFENPRMCRHFHMSIQSANTEILRAMKRHYDSSHVEEALLKIAERVPNAFIGMDVIVGFPGETDEQFLDTVERLQRLPWTRIHVFPYSERPGTKAALLDRPVDLATRRLRSQVLREVSSQRMAIEARRQIGLDKSALILKLKSNGSSSRVDGLADDYWPLRIVDTAGAEFDADLASRLRLKREVKVKVHGWLPPQGSNMDGCLLASPLEIEN